MKLSMGSNAVRTLVGIPLVTGITALAGVFLTPVFIGTEGLTGSLLASVDAMTSGLIAGCMGFTAGVVGGGGLGGAVARFIGRSISQGFKIGAAVGTLMAPAAAIYQTVDAYENTRQFMAQRTCANSFNNSAIAKACKEMGLKPQKLEVRTQF